MTTAVDDVQNAIITLYGTHDPALREQANRALMSYQDTLQAWGVAMALLLPPASTSSAPPLEVQYFAANVLHTKATRDWAQISQEPGQGTAIMQSLLRYLQQQQPQQHRGDEHRLVLFRVCYTLTTLAVKSTPSGSSPSHSFSGITHLVNEAFQFLGGNADAIPSSPATSLTIGLCLLRALPEEVGRVDMSRARREELQQGTLRQIRPQVVRAVELLVLQRRRDVGRLALETLEAWVGLGGGREVARKGGGLTLTTLAQEAPGLFERLLEVLAGEGAGERGSEGREVEVRVAVCKLFMRLVDVSEDYPPPLERAVVVQRLYEAVLVGASSAMNGEDESLVHAFASFVVDLCTQEAEGLGRGINMQMVELMLEMTACENMHISTLALEFWEALMEVRVVERNPFLREPLCQRLVAVLVGRLAYPSRFTTWEEELSLEEEDFVRFREGDALKAVLESCYAILLVHFFQQLWPGPQQQQQRGDGHICPSSIDVFPSWQAHEVILLLFQLVARPVLAHIQQLQQQQRKKQQQQQQQQQQEEDGNSPTTLTTHILLNFLQHNLSIPNLATTGHPLLLRALHRLLGTYQSLLLPLPPYPPPVNNNNNNNNNPDRLLSSSPFSVPFLLHGSALLLLLPGLSRHDTDKQSAAMAFRSLCIGALPPSLPPSYSLQTTDLILTGLKYAEEGKCEMTVKLLLIESIVRTILSVEQVGQAKHLLEKFARNLLEKNIKGPLLALERDGGRDEEVGEGLQMFGQVVRFLDGKTLEETMFFAEDLVREAWPLLEQAAEVGGRRGGREIGEVGEEGGVGEREGGRVILDQLFPLYQYLVVGLRRVIEPLLGELLRGIVGLYENTLHEGALETVGQVVEMFPGTEGKRRGGTGGGGWSSGGSDDCVFAELFLAMANRTFIYIRAGHPPQEFPELVSAFFDMSLRFLTFRRHVFMTSPALPTVIDLALVCLEVTMEEKEVTRSVLRLLKDLFKILQEHPGEGYILPTYRLFHESRGACLVTRTLTALAGGAPSTLWSSYFEAFFALLQAWPVAAVAAGGGGDHHDHHHHQQQQQQQQQGELVIGGWIEAAVFDFQVLREESFSREDRHLLVQLIGMWGVGVGAKKQKLKLVLDDVLKIAASEMEVHALRNYLVVG